MSDRLPKQVIEFVWEMQKRICQRGDKDSAEAIADYLGHYLVPTRYEDRCIFCGHKRGQHTAYCFINNPCEAVSDTKDTGDGSHDPKTVSKGNRLMQGAKDAQFHQRCEEEEEDDMEIDSGAFAAATYFIVHEGNIYKVFVQGDGRINFYKWGDKRGWLTSVERVECFEALLFGARIFADSTDLVKKRMAVLLNGVDLEVWGGALEALDRL